MTQGRPSLRYLHSETVRRAADVARIVLAAALFVAPSLALGDIYQWEWNDPTYPGQGKSPSTTLCPGGAGVAAVPYADFSGRDLTQAYLIGADLTQATIGSATVTNADFGAAIVKGVNFFSATQRGFVAEQLYSTASYLSGDLGSVRFDYCDLTGWSFWGKDLTDASFHYATLTGATFTRAVLTNANFRAANLTNTDLCYTTLAGADFTGATVAGAFLSTVTAKGFTAQQLYSTASYQSGDLNGIALGSNVLAGWDLAGKNLRNACFGACEATNLNLAGSDLAYAFLRSSVLKSANLSGANLLQADLREANLTTANLRGADLTYADLFLATMTNADFTGAIVNGTHFQNGTNRGFTAQQLYSTASYRNGDLSHIGLESNYMSGWDFAGKNLTGACLQWASLVGAKLTNADLTNAILSNSRLTNVDFAGAIVNGTDLTRSTSNGFTAQQLYSTASYQSGDLARIHLGGNDLSGWDFSGKNLSGGSLCGAILTNANLTGANLRDVNMTSAALANATFAGATLNGARFEMTDFSAQQLYSSASYQTGDISRIGLSGRDVSGWNFAHKDLSGADLSGATLAGTVFNSAIVRGTNFANASGTCITAQQLYSTASYQGGDLSGIVLTSNDLTGWNFAGKNLTDANLWGAIFTGTVFTGATVKGVDFGVHNYQSLTAQQLYSTASYQTGDLGSIGLSFYDLTEWNFAGKNLAGADFIYATLTNANFSDARLEYASLSGANFTGATLKGAILRGCTLSALQLYSTASYQCGDLSRVGFDYFDLAGWNFAGKNLAGATFAGAGLESANFAGANLTDADFQVNWMKNAVFSGADLRGATRFGDAPTAITTNMIWPDGTIRGLRLDAFNPVLAIRDYNGTTPRPIRVTQAASFGTDSLLHVLIEDSAWGSTIAFDAGIAASLGGRLKLGVAAGVDPSGLVGSSYQLFDWTGISPVGHFEVVSDLPTGYSWAISELYSTGFVTMIAPRTRTWHTTVGIDWSNSESWDCDVDFAPTDVLVFSGAGAISNNDLTNQGIGRLTFAPGSGSFELSGHAIEIAGMIDNQATAEQEISLPVEFVMGLESGTVNIVSGGELTISESVSGDQGLTKTGLGILRLLQDTAYTGDTTVEEGTLVLKGLDNDGSTTVSGTLIADYICQTSLTITADGLVEIAASGSGSPGASSAVPSTVPVPEPATWLLLATVALAGLICRRHRS